MIINYSNEKIIKSNKSIFLAGPTTMFMHNSNWRKKACKYLKELNYDGVVYVPEYSNNKRMNFEDEVLWEREALENSSLILFWIPRKLPHMPAFTTNVEFGYWIHSKKIIYGRPNSSAKNRYLDWLYKYELNKTPYNNLNDLIKASIKILNNK